MMHAAIKMGVFMVAVWLFTGCKVPAKQTVSEIVLQDTLKKTTIIDSAGSALLRLKERLDAGIDFVASGTEPFWSLEIDFDKQFHFKKMDSFEMMTPVPEGVKAADAPVMRYRAITERGEIIVQLAYCECTNSMSGDTSAYSVTVDTKTNREKDYTRYNGCGNYTADYRINDIWVLEQVNKKALKRDAFMKGLPQLEINLEQRKVFGHSGCNTLNGTAEVQGKRLSFGRFITTKMACPDLDFENHYIKSLQQRSIPYKVEGGKLQLQIGVDTVYTYRKID